MRIAYFSPLPPSESGIADYSMELLPHLAQHVDVTLFFDPQQPPAPQITEAFEAADVKVFPQRRQDFDIALYHMGNAGVYHEAIWRTLQEHPGVVVVHDTVFYHFFQEINVARDDFAGFRAILQDTYGDRAARRVMNHLDDGIVNPVTFPLLRPVVNGALGAIAHSQYAANQVAERCPDVPVTVIPHHLSLPAPFDDSFDRAAIQRDLGLADRFVVGTFGFLTAWKRISVALSAFAHLYQYYSDAVYCLVGDLRLSQNLDDLIHKLGLPREAVRVTGRLPLSDFLRYMAATDVAINLRYPTAGETSGTLIRLLGLGTPTIVSDVGSFAEFPDDVCAKVPVDSFEHETLTSALEALAHDPTLRQAMSVNAHKYVRTHHTLEGSAQAYVDFVEQLVTGEVESAQPATPSSASLLSEIGCTLAGWGVTEHDDELLEPIAQAIAQLGIDPER